MSFRNPIWITPDVLATLRMCNTEHAARRIADAVDDAFEHAFAAQCPGMIRARRALARLQAAIGQTANDPDAGFREWANRNVRNEPIIYVRTAA